MRNQNPADSRAMDSNDGDTPVGDFPPLPNESVVPAEGQQSSVAVSSMEAFVERLDVLSDDVLEKSTIELRRSINAAQAQFSLQVRELERRDIPRLSISSRPPRG